MDRRRALSVRNRRPPILGHCLSQSLGWERTNLPVLLGQRRAGRKSPSCPLTDPHQFDILPDGSSPPGSNAVLGRSTREFHLLPTRSFPTRRLAAAALLPIAGAFFVLLFSATDSRAQNPSGNCEEGAAEVTVLSTPMAPWKGAPLRVVFAAEKPLDGELS